jgi:DNA-binding NtrC family response regulator
LDIPPLRERGSDIVALANHLLGIVAKRYRSSLREIPREQESFLISYPWPGNVREMMHELERQMVWGGGERLDFSHLIPSAKEKFTPAVPSAPIGAPEDWLAPGWRFPEEGFSLDDSIDRLIRLALAQSYDNVSAAARLLGVKRDFIRYRMKSVGK